MRKAVLRGTLVLILGGFFCLTMFVLCGATGPPELPPPRIGDPIIYVSDRTGETCAAVVTYVATDGPDATVNLGYWHQDGRADSNILVPHAPGDRPKAGYWFRVGGGRRH